MNSVFPFIALFPVLLLVLFGYLIKYKKAYWLISGYNTMSAEKKKNVSTEELGRFMGNVCFTIAGIVLVASVLLYLKLSVEALIVFALIFPIVIYILIHAQKFDGNNFDQEGNVKTSTKVIVGLVIGFLIITMVGVGLLLYSSSKPAEYSVVDGVLSISGMYGQEVKLSEIESIEIKDTRPEVLTKTNGSALGNKLKGYFRLQDIDRAKLFVDTSKPPFIFIKTNSMLFIINCEDSAKTNALYQEIKNGINIGS